MEKLAAVIWGVPTMMLLLLVGILLSVRTKFVQLRMLWPSICHVCRSAAGKGKTSFRAVCTALAGTVGTGNVAGVAGAIALGGPGALFWMWISAFFGMATKYAEVVLAVRYRKKGDDGSFRGGPMYYIRHGMGERWKPLAAVFALFAMLSSFGMGNMAQVHTIVSAIRTALPQVRPEPLSLLIGLITALLVLWMTADGGRSVGSLMERLVPVMAAVYVFGAGAVIWCHRMELDTVFRAVCFGAFSPEAVLGGGAGIGIQQTIRWGVARGIFSNEAGLGSAPIAHAAAEATPEEQGLFGVFEVFLDTLVLCTLTGFAILSSGVPVSYGTMAGAELAVAALETVFGNWSAGGLAVCLSMLALATVVTWQFYGSQCADYLWGARGETAYRLCYTAAMLLGATMDVSTVWVLSDLCNGMMCLPNLIALLILGRNLPAKQGDLCLDIRRTAFHNDGEGSNAQFIKE